MSTQAQKPGPPSSRSRRRPTSKHSCAAIIAAVVPTALRSVGAVFEAPSDENIEERAGKWLVSRLREFDGTLIIDDFHRAVADERVARVARERNRRDARPDALDRRIARIAGAFHGLVDRARLDGTARHQRRPRASRSKKPASSRSRSKSRFGDGLAAIVDETLGWPIGVRLALSLVARKRAIAAKRACKRAKRCSRCSTTKCGSRSTRA